MSLIKKFKKHWTKKMIHLIGEQHSLNESQVWPPLAPMSEN